MGYYAYLLLLPDEIADTLTRAAENFAAEHHLSAHAWYRDLPIWRITGRRDGRTDLAQIAAIQTGEGKLLSFSPEAYEDAVTYDDGFAIRTRRAASAADVRAGSFDLKLDEFLNHPQGEKEALITGRLGRVWASAVELALTESRQWTRPTVTTVPARTEG